MKRLRSAYSLSKRRGFTRGPSRRGTKQKAETFRLEVMTALGGSFQSRAGGVVVHSRVMQRLAN